jgi:hypothetical protein
VIPRLRRAWLWHLTSIRSFRRIRYRERPMLCGQPWPKSLARYEARALTAALLTPTR